MYYDIHDDVVWPQNEWLIYMALRQKLMCILEDFHSLETIYLLGNPVNAQRLAQSMAQLKAGEVIDWKLPD